jgi:hypothetical protein
MTMAHRLPVVVAIWTAATAGALGAPPAFAQSVAAESAIAAGYSSEEHVSAGGVQLRLLGEAKPSLRFFVEGAWAATSNQNVDAFSSAYPYGNQLQVIEAYGDWRIRSDAKLFAVKAGRYRTPFGISNGSDHGYGGFSRAPLMRYDGYFALSNSFLEHGVSVLAGVPQITLEVSVGTPADVGTAERRGGIDAVVRAQRHAGPFIVGANYITTNPYQSPRFARGRARFGGVDVRWMREGVQVRGELLHGRPFDGTWTTGWYADVFVHRLGMGPVTLVGRIERLGYDATPPFDVHAGRQVVGARARVAPGLVVQTNLIRHTGEVVQSDRIAFDVGVSYSVRRD